MSLIITTKPMPTLTVTLPPELAERLAERQRRGEDVEYVLVHAIEAEIAKDRTPKEGLHPGMTFRELHAPLREDFEKTGMTDDELSDFIEEEVKAYRRELREREAAGDVAA